MAQESRYSKVFVKIWHSKDFRTLSEEGKMLFLYLLTSPHRNMGGFYYLPLPYLCFDVGLDEKRVSKAFKELTDKDMALYDFDAQVVLIKKWFCYNPIENENQAKGLNKQLAEIPKSKLFKPFVNCVKEYCKYIESILKGFDIPSENHSETLPKPYAKPGTGTGSGTETGSELSNIYALGSALAQNHSSGSVEAEKVTATLDDKPPESRPRSPFTSKRQEQLFDEFWAEYPKKRSKGQAEKTWVKIKPDEQLFEAIMTGLKRAKTSVDWTKNGGQYIPYPSTWLNAKGWEDEYKEVSSSGKHQRHTSGYYTPGYAKSQSNRFAGLARNGGTGRVVGGQDRPLGSGNSPPPGDIKKCPGNDSSYQVTGGMPMAR